MNHRLKIYLDQVIAYAGLPPEQSALNRKELEDHLLTKIEDLQKEGASMDDAVFRAIHDHGRPSAVGYALRPSFPLIDVRTRGTARGVIAVGPRAVGIVACGIVASGILSCGFLSFGVISFGAITLALLLGMGGCALGAVALGMNALGFFARGLNAFGVIATGENAYGFWCLPYAENATQFFNGPMPSWLKALGLMLHWNLRETLFALGPLLLLMGVLLFIAVRSYRREVKRLDNKNVQSWMFE